MLTAYCIVHKRLKKDMRNYRISNSTDKILLPSGCTSPNHSTLAHLGQNYAALELQLSAEDSQQLDQAFPPPKKPTPLQML